MAPVRVFIGSPTWLSSCQGSNLAANPPKPFQDWFLANESHPTANCPSTPDGSGTICYTPQTAPVLKLGSRGKLVSNVQSLMKVLGYLNTQPNEIYGTQTRTAVMRFQRANRINPDGVVGARTWMAIMRANAG